MWLASATIGDNRRGFPASSWQNDKCHDQRQGSFCQGSDLLFEDRCPRFRAESYIGVVPALRFALIQCCCKHIIRSICAIKLEAGLVQARAPLFWHHCDCQLRQSGGTRSVQDIVKGVPDACWGGNGAVKGTAIVPYPVPGQGAPNLGHCCA